jgi:hypothetical protein
VKPILKLAAEEEREKHLFLYWNGVPFNRWMLFASSFLSQFCCGSLYAWFNFNALIDIFIYGTKTANKAPNTFYIAVGTFISFMRAHEIIQGADSVFVAGMFGTTAMLMGPSQERHGPRRGLFLSSIIFGVGQGNAAFSFYKKSIAGGYVGYGILGGLGLGLNYICPVSRLPRRRNCGYSLQLCWDNFMLWISEGWTKIVILKLELVQIGLILVYVHVYRFT